MKKHPSAPVGLGALLARLASLSKLQTAAVCVALAAVPVGWQWKEHRQADDQVRRMRAQLLTTLTNRTNAQAGLERLRAHSTQLEESLAQANDAVAHPADSALAFAAWKQETRGLPAAADHGWSDESPFVRIPKAILPELSALIKIPPFAPPGVVNPSARELLGLTLEERQAIENILQHVAEMQRGEKAGVYETEGPVSGRTVASRLFMSEPPGKVGPEAEQRFAQMLADLRAIIGEERWSVVPSRFRTVNCDVLNRMLIPEPAGHVSASVELDENGIPQAKWTLTGGVTPAGAVKPPPPAVDKATGGKAPQGNVYSVNVVGYVNHNAALSAFLPDAEPEQRRKAANFSGIDLPPTVKQRVAAWFEEQAVARLTGPEKP